MIPARKRPLFDAFFTGHARSRLRASFAEVRVRGGERARAAAAGGPVLIVSNHTAWWDPLFSLWIANDVLGVDGHAMMDAANLTRLPFFGLVGAFGVDRQDPADGARALRYAVRLLDAPRRMVWIFAQGDERPITEPIAFRPGAAEVASLARGAFVLPVAFRYEFNGLERPIALASLGEPIAPSAGKRRVTTAELEAKVRAELAALDAALCDGSLRAGVASPAWPTLLRAPTSPWGALAERLLAWLTAPRGSPRAALPARSGDDAPAR